MWNKVSRVSEWVTNLGSVGLLIYVAVALANPRRNVKLPPRAAPLRAGQAVHIDGVDWTKAQHTLVFALQTGCHFCADSAPFYKALLKEQTGSWQAVAVLPQPVEQSTAYMRKEGYSVAQVRQTDLSAIGVAGTPTLMLVDKRGKLEQEWVGKLEPSGEDAVAAALGLGKIAQDEPRVVLAGMGLASAAPANSDGSVTGAPAPQSSADAGMKRVTFPWDPNAPARIVQVLEGATDVTGAGRDPVTGHLYKPWTGKPFPAGDDWIKNLVFVVKNFSNKKVIAMDINMIFPDTGAGTMGSPVSGSGITVGRKPEHALYNSRTGRKAETKREPFSILPGQEVRIAVAPYYDPIKAAIEAKQPTSTITTFRVSFVDFYFSDGTKFDPGGFWKPDPNRPGVYVRMTSDEWSTTTPIEN